MLNNQILKIYGTEYTQMTMRLLEAADLIGRIPKEAKVIGIKPNLVAPMTADFGGTTHPEVVEGIIRYLQAHGDFDIRVMEGSWVGDKTGESFEVCGYLDLAARTGVKLIDCQKEKSHPVDCAGMELQICDCVSEVDFLINVPVLKGHCQTKITCALKNMKGLIPNKEKRHFHAMSLHKPIAHLSAGIHQDFIVVDHICGDLDFEDGGHPVVRNCVMAAADPVLVDAYVCHLLGHDVADVPYVQIAGELGIGCADITRAEVLKLVKCSAQETASDSSAADVANVDSKLPTNDDWELIPENDAEALPRSTKLIELKDLVEEVDSCSACYGYLLPALDMLRDEGLFEELMKVLPDKIRIGQGYKGQTGAFGIGNCTRGFDFRVKGCPPTETEIYEALKDYIIQHRQDDQPI